MKPFSQDGTLLDAQFGVELIDGVMTLVLESAGGGRNADYNGALKVLLARLTTADASITNAIVDSTVSRELPSEERRLRVRNRDYPIRLRSEANIEDLRIAICAAQPPVAQQPGAKGGSPVKRIRLFLDLSGDPAAIQSRLASGSAITPEVSEAVAAIEHMARGSSPGQGRGLTGPQRKAVEMHAMAVVEANLKADDWLVEDVSRRRSFDLLATRKGETLYVEVKGTTGAGRSVLLTRNEVRHAAEYGHEAAICVVSEIDLDRDASPPAAGGGVLRSLKPWHLGDGELEPVGYEWILPPV